MKASKKIEKKLAVRLNDYGSMMAAGSKESKVEQRMRTGGFRRPGSRQK